MNHVHDSTREKQERTTQYISHGVNCAGSEVRRALYEAKMGKRIVIIELVRKRHQYWCLIGAVAERENTKRIKWRGVIGMQYTYERRFGSMSNITSYRNFRIYAGSN